MNCPFTLEDVGQDIEEIYSLHEQKSREEEYGVDWCVFARDYAYDPAVLKTINQWWNGLTGQEREDRIRKKLISIDEQHRHWLDLYEGVCKENKGVS